MSHHHDHDDDHEHDLGFRHDLPKLIGRRSLLALMGGLGAVALSSASAAALDCVALPWETQGPYPADGSNVRNGQVVNALTEQGVIRQDLRPSFGNLTAVAEGVQLDVELTLIDADGCTPLPGHAIYLWHCDARGRYSLYDTPDANHLRGVGVADAEGKVRFTTIFPGCYAGRWPHFHFEVFESIEKAVDGDASILTAQIALSEADCATVYGSDSRYTNGLSNLDRVTLATDGIFRDNTAEQVAQQTMVITGDVATGLTGTVTIPLAL